MNAPYQETIAGSTFLRKAPGARHEVICARLHECMKAGVANFLGTRLLAPRACLEVAPRSVISPDLALVASATGKLWLAAEVVSSEDHQPDTVDKKQLYEDIRIARLWMIDPRYDNVEIYHGTPYGLSLKAILAGKDVLNEKLLPEFQITVAELFRLG